RARRPLRAQRLLCRFYDPDEGQVLIDGQDLRAVTQRSLRQVVGVVPQDTVLFNATMRENIGFGRFNARMAELAEAARGAEILSFIENTLPDKVCAPRASCRRGGANGARATSPPLRRASVLCCQRPLLAGGVCS